MNEQENSPEELLEEEIASWVLNVRRDCTSGQEFSTKKHVAALKARCCEVFMPEACRELNKKLHRRTQEAESALARAHEGNSAYSAGWRQAITQARVENERAREKQFAEYKAASRKTFARERAALTERIEELAADLQEEKARLRDRDRIIEEMKISIKNLGEMVEARRADLKSAQEKIIDLLER